MTKNFLILPGTAFSLSLGSLKPSSVLPPTFTTLHWNCLLKIQMSDTITTNGPWGITHHIWCVGFPSNGNTLQLLMVYMDHMLGHLVVNSFQHKPQPLWKSGTLLLLRSSLAYNSLELPIPMNHPTPYQTHFLIHQMDIPWPASFTLQLLSGIYRQVGRSKRFVVTLVSTPGHCYGHWMDRQSALFF